MADPFIAEIRIFPFNFAPKGWAWCDGQLLPLSQNTALFSLLGTTYGGNGKSNFALPDLQGRAPMHPGRGQVSACTIWAKPAAAKPSLCWNPRYRVMPTR
jgi:microcystin-dependent protein